MAWKLAVVHRSILPAIAKISVPAAVYLSFCLYGNPDGTSAFPSLHKMAEDLGVDHRSVQRAVRSLQAAGLLVLEGTRGRLVRSYRVVKLAADTPLDELLASGAYAVSQIATSGNHAAITSGKNGHQLAADTPPNQIPRPDPIDHLRRGSASPPPPPKTPKVDLAALKEPGPGAPSAQEAASPPAGERKGRPGPTPPRSETEDERYQREADERFAAEEAYIARMREQSARPPTQPTEAEECEGQALRLLDEGVLPDLPPASRLACARSAVVNYRVRWPRSWPCDWIHFASLPQLDGKHVKNRAAWLWSHVSGYAHDWTPENQDGSTRKWHQALLDGDAKQATALAHLENSYAPERASARFRANNNGSPRLVPV